MMGVAGVGIGLAMQGVLGNLVSGLLIIFMKPSGPGYIEIAATMGGDRHRTV
jgi:small conductance mechanosensitive channel